MFVKTSVAKKETCVNANLDLFPKISYFSPIVRPFSKEVIVR